MKQKGKIIAVVLLSLLMLVQVAKAQGGGLVGCVNDCTLKQLVDVVIRVINYLLSLAGFVAMIFIVWSGWGMVNSGGNEEKITAAKASFSNAIIGFFLILAAYVLLDAIINVLTGGSLRDYYGFVGKKP